MGNKIFNDSQMVKVHGAGVGNYIEGGLKIAAGAGLAALSVRDFVMEARCGDMARCCDCYAEVLGRMRQSSVTRGTIETALAAGLAFSGINQILNERRMSKLEKNKK